MNNPKPLKKFGQNYLIDNNIIEKIVNVINPEKQNNIIEIGPGRGAITNLLTNVCDNVTAVEIDTRVIQSLKEKFPNLKIINQDFLKVDLSEFVSDSKLRIAGNIPYNITSPIIFKMLESRKFIKDSVLMVQNEVAKRMTSTTGSKDYGILSVLLSYFADTKYCFKISPNVFRPKPKVDSAIVKITFKDFENEFPDKLFIQVVKAAFGNRRKTLKNSLSNSIFHECDFSDCELNFKKRAEQLGIEEYLQLTKFIFNQRNDR